MALVRGFSELIKDCRMHDEVECTYTIVEHNGATLLQLDTYGRASRQELGKVSQSIQLDRSGAEALTKLLKQTFLI